MTCEYCEHDDDNVRGIYVCPHCGSREMVDKANELTGGQMSKRISDGLLHLFTQGIELENITVHQNIAMAKELLKLRTALKKAMKILLTDDEQAKTELFLELKGYL